MVEEDSYQHATEMFHLLSHPARLHILDELRRAEACVCHLQTVLKRPQAYISQQLRVLREAEVVVPDKDGLNVYYRVVSRQAEHLLEEVLGPAGEPTRLLDCPCPYCQKESRTFTAKE